MAGEPWNKESRHGLLDPLIALLDEPGPDPEEEPEGRD